MHGSAVRGALLLLLLAGAVLHVNGDEDIFERFMEEYGLPRSCASLPPFRDYSPHLKWLDELVRQDQRPSTRSLEEYVRLLLPYIECSPPPAKVTTRPFNLTYDCNAPGWAGKREKPMRIVDIFPVAHELDVLDMRFYELEDVVDMFVVFESTYSHRVWKRPLFFERSKLRYRRFMHKIFHVVSDDSTLAKSYDPMKQLAGDDWRGEVIMRTMPWQSLKNAFGEESFADTIFVHSDLDEIPNAKTILQYKHCIPGPALDLPVVLTCTFYRHNFDYVIWDDEKPVLFTAQHMAGVFGNTLPRFTDRKVNNKHNDPNERSYSLNRLSNSYGDIFKDLALAEGGSVQRGAEMARKMAIDPPITDEWRFKGIRNCCPGDTQYLHPRSPDMPVPWFAWFNKHRFPHLFPNECAINPEECVY